MHKLCQHLLMVTLVSSPCLGGVIKLNLDGSGTGTFAGLGSANATYSDTIQILNENTGALDNFQLVLALTGSGPITLATTGLGIGDSSINDGESLRLSVSLTPSAGTQSGIGSFELSELGHGLTASDFPKSFVAVSDGAAINILADGAANTADVSNLDGQTVTVSASTAPFTPGSVEGIQSLSFRATAVPEPSSFFMCCLLAGGLGIRRPRRKSLLR